ncbi:MAG: hypothetical protein HY727_05830 [Candidatus Rokubacteria bacterium]|nr:hypothetical protein [Candidatus Rokubacteria bacterium]
MADIEWRDLSRRDGLRLREDVIEVQAADERVQRVSVAEDEPGSLRIWTVVAHRSIVERLDKPELVAWVRNRHVEIVDFRIDSHGRLIGEAVVATAGLTGEEWGFYVRTVANASDRLEYLLTGRDAE